MKIESHVISKVCEYGSDEIKITPELLTGNTRLRSVSDARCIIWWILFHKYNMTDKNILGGLFGKDRTTVIAGLRKVEALMQDKKFLEKYDKIVKEL